MAVHIKSEEARLIRKLIPLATFPSAAFEELCSTIKVEQIQDGLIFKKGDTNTDLVYLLSGSVTLQAEGLAVEEIAAENESAKFALAHQIPRKIDAVANGVARIVRLSAEVVNNPPPAVYREDYVISDESDEDSDDWMSAVLRLPVFQSLPPVNLQKILMTLRTTHYTQGDVIMANGSAVDYFYVITKGQCLLSRLGPGESGEIRLGVGDSFGDEYLIMDQPARETVTALTDVSLVQLEKRHFLAQIKTPLLRFMAYEDLPEAVMNGAALLDVRLPENYEAQHLADSVNIPLMSLRMQVEGLPKGKRFIIVCADGKASEAGAFLLVKNNIDATVLKNGMGIEEPELTAEIAEPTDNQDQGFSQGDPVDQPDEAISGRAEEVVTDQLSLLMADNELLLSRISDLEGKCVRLQAEKEEAEQRCVVLTQQLATLKTFLNKFQSK